MIHMKFRKSYVYTVNGHKYRDIEELKPRDELGNFEFDWIGTEVFTPKCGWVVDDTNPSFDCNQCSPECNEYKKWEEFLLSL